MKKIIAYNLLIVVLFSFNYRAINYYFKLSKPSIVFNQDYDCEENNSESQKSDEKNEKKEDSEYLFFNKIYSLVIDDRIPFTQKSSPLFIASDHSNVVYSPPEQLYYF